MLPARHRLRAPGDFSATTRGAARCGHPLMVVHAVATDARSGEPPRVGFVVSRAVGNAVMRNRTKRRLRALVAGRLGALPGGVDVVVRAHPPAAQATFTELEAAFAELFECCLRSPRLRRRAAAPTTGRRR